jgi:flagellar L-ring protein precursor FlgH
MKSFARLIFVLAVAALPAIAQADTLYQAAPPIAGPGHPLRLGADHRASQTGDLVYVEFDFSSQNSKTNNYSSSKDFALSQGVGTGNLGFSLLKNGASLGGSSTTQTQQAATGSNTLISTMMARVVDVLPSGTLQIVGDQALIVNGQKQTLEITGYIRAEDVDATDAVLSSRVADVQATLTGNDQKNKGLLSRILAFLF